MSKVFENYTNENATYLGSTGHYDVYYTNEGGAERLINVTGNGEKDIHITGYEATTDFSHLPEGVDYHAIIAEANS